MEHNPSSSTKADRKTIEKNRRNHLKGLYSELHSLVPLHSSRGLRISLIDQLDEAANYIKKLQTKLEKMKGEKERLMRMGNMPNEGLISGELLANVDSRPPQIDIHEIDSAIEVNLITSLDCDFMFTETIRILHEEGLEIVNASFSVTKNTVFHTIHSKVGDYAAGGLGARISERLNKFVAGAN